jgi:hypothetical protein
MRLGLELARRRPARQRVFEFVERSGRHVRSFKLMILAVTALTASVLLAGVPRGRYLAGVLVSQARRGWQYALGLPVPRAEIDQEWRRYRLHGIAESALAVEHTYAETDSADQRLMRYAGLDPAHALLRWGNYNLTLLLPSTIFEADDTGRSYRLRSKTRSIWLRQLTIKSGVLMFFLVPDGPELAEAIKGTTAIPVESSRQTTNSWGLRGPEPDLGAPLRGIVLGDSYMQGMFIGDDVTPPECLRRGLEKHFKTRVSILNTGHLGYSPEQYYYSLVEYADRFRPHFVLVSVYTNDFGDIDEVPARGRGDWPEGKYWLDRIMQFCRSRRWPHLLVPMTFESQILGRRRSGFYPGMVSNILEVSGLTFLDPTDDLINAHLRVLIDGERRGNRPQDCPLYNRKIGDGHLSPLGSKVWADAVSQRLCLLLESEWALREKAPTGAPRETAVRPAGEEADQAILDLSGS